MAKDLQTSVETAIAAQQHAVRVLVEIALTGATLRFCSGKSDLVFPHPGGDTFTAKAIKIPNIKQAPDQQISRITIKLDNVAQDMAGYINTYMFPGATLTVKRVYLDTDLHAPASADEYVEVFSGLIEEIKDIREWAPIVAATGKALSSNVLTRSYTRSCNHVFGSDACNTSGYADLTSLTASGTADSGSTTTLTDNALTQADDYWNYGLIEITHNGLSYNRVVTDFDAGTDTITLDLALPVAVDNTTAYTIYKGCDKTLETCGGSNAYGPSADNSDNFGGFIHATTQG